MKLKRKIFLIFSLVAVIPMIFLTTYTVVQYTHMIDNRMEDISHEQQENLSDAIDASYTSIRQVFMLLTFASNTDSSIIKILRPYADPEIHMTNMEIYRACLQLRNANQNIFYTYDFLNGVYVYTPSGNLISYETSKNGTIAQTYNPKNDDWYNRTIEPGGKMYYSSLDKHPMFESKNKSIFFSQTIIDPDTGKFLGVLIIDCSPELFNLDSVNALGNMNLITLTNTNNQSVYYTNDSDGSFSIKPDASNTLYTEIDHTPLLLALTLDYSSLREDYTRIAFLLVIVSALCILCVLLFTFYFSNSMLLPIEELSEQMLHQSDPVVHSKKDYTCRKDEIGTLYRQYDMMLEKLNASIKKDYQDKLIVLDAQMKSLEARINSHFLFNTLESINSLAEIDENEDIATMSLALGNMFRYAIKTESELVTLEQELRHVQDYVAIQSIRFDNRFHLSVTIPEELYELKVLKLILQPLVENALCHGLHYCTSGDQITIHGYVADRILHIFVSDNGCGISPEELERIRQYLNEEAVFTELGHRNKQSIGLKNIQSRIELYYGKGYGLTIHSQLTQGTEIEIKIPVFQSKED